MMVALEKVTGPFKHGNFWVSMLDFWAVDPYHIPGSFSVPSWMICLGC